MKTHEKYITEAKESETNVIMKALLKSIKTEYKKGTITKEQYDIAMKGAKSFGEWLDSGRK